jgi:hypothetical protein
MVKCQDQFGFDQNPSQETVKELDGKIILVGATLDQLVNHLAGSGSFGNLKIKISNFRHGIYSRFYFYISLLYKFRRIVEFVDKEISLRKPGKFKCRHKKPLR